MNSNIISNYPYNSFSFNQISGSSKAALVLSGIEQYFIDPIVFVSGNDEQTIPIINLNFGNKDIILTNNKHSFQMGKNAPSSKFAFIQFNSGEAARFLFGTKYNDDGTIVRDYINVSYKTGVLNLNKRPYVNYSGIVLVGEGVLLNGNQTIHGNKKFQGAIQIGGPENAIYSDDDYNLVISGLDDTPQGMKFVLANDTKETSIIFDPDYHGLVFQGDSYYFQNRRPQILNTGDYSLRDIALSDEVVSLTGNQNVSGNKTFLGNLTINNLTVTGIQSIINTSSINVGSNYMLLNVTGGGGVHGPATDGGIFFITGSGLSGINDSGAVLGYDSPGNKWVFGIASRNDDIEYLNEIASVSLVTGLSGKAVLLDGNQTIAGTKTFSSTIAGSINGNAATVTNGVYTAGDQTIGGIKTFSSRPMVNNTGVLLSGEAAQLPSTIVYTTGDQIISGIKTFAEGINLDSIDSLNLSGVDISIRDGTVNLLGTSNIPTLADIFPASSAVRRYRPMGVGSTTSSSPSYQNIQYFPFLIRKDAVNPQIAIELVSSGAAALSSFPIRYGIYSGQDGFQGAKLFHSGSINCTTTGIFKANIPLTLKKGPYIIATSNTGVSSPAATFRASSAQTFGEIFGEPTFNTTLFNGNSTAVFWDTGVDLNATIGSSFVTSLARAPIPCIEY